MTTSPHPEPQEPVPPRSGETIDPGLRVAPAGWYADPWFAGQFRWFDGHTWSAFNAGPTSGRRPWLRGYLSLPVAVCAPFVLVYIALVILGAPWSLPLSVIPMLFVVPVLIWFDRIEPETPASKFHSFAWGATVAVAISLAVNTLVDRYFGSAIAATVGAPLIEEATKGLGVLWAYRRREIDSISDGIIFAGWVALGFAVVEDVTYFAQADSAGQLAAVVVARAVLSPFAHPLFTCWIGAAIGWSVRSDKPVFPRVLAGYLAAVGLHALWNGSVVLAQDESNTANFLAVVATFFVIFVATAVVVVLLRKGDERRVTAAIPRLRQRYGLTPAEVAAFSDWSTTIATRQALPRSERRRFDRLHAGVSGLAQLSSRPAGISPADEGRLLAQIGNARLQN